MINLLRKAYQFASDNSDDKSTKVGAIITNKNKDILVIGVNKFPGNLGNDPLNHERPLKYKLIEHAERNVIFLAARIGLKTEGLILISTWAACPDCARAIVLAGIKEVYTHAQSFDMTPKRWVKDINIGIKILKDSSVSFNLINTKIGGCKNLFNGEIWYP